MLKKLPLVSSGFLSPSLAAVPGTQFALFQPGAQSYKLSGKTKKIEEADSSPPGLDGPRRSCSVWLLEKVMDPRVCAHTSAQSWRGGAQEDQKLEINDNKKLFFLFLSPHFSRFCEIGTRCLILYFINKSFTPY